MSAKVWLVGAGPGDPELLTLKAVRALGEAQVVMIDDLVNPAVLEHCPNARIIPVGKRGGCRSTPQAFIHRLMLRYARQGKCVALSIFSCLRVPAVGFARRFAGFVIGRAARADR